MELFIILGAIALAVLWLVSYLIGINNELIIILGVLILAVLWLIFYIIGTYNKLIKARNRIETQWAQIDVQLIRRADLIPRLIETVKDYATHEKEIFEKVTTARSALGSATSPTQAMTANDNLSKQLMPLFAVAESYPDLKANVVFIDLMSSLKDTENKIAHSRQFYNDTVLIYRDRLQKFPSNIYAKMFGFKDESHYVIDRNIKDNAEA